MAKAERLIELMITINAKMDFTIGELAAEFSVSKRTIMRDLHILESLGFPLYSEVGAAGGYHLLKKRVLPPIAFLESEAKALFFAYQSLEFYQDLPFEQESVSALKKLLNCLPADMQHSITQIQDKIVFWTPDRHCNTPLLKELFEFVISGAAATILYSSNYNSSSRLIVPIGLYAMNGLWYCPAYCPEIKTIREFRVDRINEITKAMPLENEKYVLPGSIHEYLNHMEVGTDYHIKIKLTEIGVKRCETEFLLARGLTILPDGGFIDMHIRKSTLEWVAEYFLSFGKHATILEPIELKESMKSKIQDLYSHYF